MGGQDECIRFKRTCLCLKQERGIMTAIDIAQCSFVCINFREQQCHVVLIVRHRMDFGIQPRHQIQHVSKRRVVLVHSLKENLGHHSFVFVIEKMTVKDGHAPDYRVGEVHNDVDRTAVWNIHGVQPYGAGNRLVVFRISQEVDLMDVHGMQFAGSINDSPMLKRPDLCSHHRSGVTREFFSIDVETPLVFRECNDESRRRLFFSSQVQSLEIRFARALQDFFR